MVAKPVTIGGAGYPKSIVGPSALTRLAIHAAYRVKVGNQGVTGLATGSAPVVTRAGNLPTNTRRQTAASSAKGAAEVLC